MKKYFFTGLIILLPLLLTLMIVLFLVDLLTDPFLDITTSFIKKWQIVTDPDYVTAFARFLTLISIVIVIFLLGLVGRWFLFSSLIGSFNSLLSRIPVVKSIYKIIKDIVAAFLSPEGRKAFKYPILLPFPFKKAYGIGFVSGEIPEECQKHFKEPLASIFVPTAPHPISGYMTMIPEKKIEKIEMTNEEAIKFIVSCGVILPEENNGSK